MLAQAGYEKEEFDALTGKGYESWVEQICRQTGYSTIGQLINHPTMQHSMSLDDGHTKTDIVLFGDTENWEKLIEHAETIIMANEFQRSIVEQNKIHVLVGQIKSSPSALSDSKNIEQLERLQTINDSDLDDCNILRAIPIVVVNGGKSEFSHWLKNGERKQWLEKFNNVSVIHFPYMSYSYLLETMQANSRKQEILFKTMEKNREKQDAMLEILLHLCRHDINKGVSTTKEVEEATKVYMYEKTMNQLKHHLFFGQ